MSAALVCRRKNRQVAAGGAVDDSFRSAATGILIAS
jgi:hypothetical protein